MRGSATSPIPLRILVQALVRFLRCGRPATEDTKTCSLRTTMLIYAEPIHGRLGRLINAWDRRDGRSGDGRPLSLRCRWLKAATSTCWTGPILAFSRRKILSALGARKARQRACYPPQRARKGRALDPNHDGLDRCRRGKDRLSPDHHPAGTPRPVRPPPPRELTLPPCLCARGQAARQVGVSSIRSCAFSSR